MERRPYPSAPTLTRPSPARPDGVRRDRPAEPIPSTVWLCPPDPDTGNGGPGTSAVVAAAVTSFSAAGERVGLLAWPIPAAVADMRAARLVPAAAPSVPVAGQSVTAAVAAVGRRPVPLRLTPSPELRTGVPPPLLDRPDPALAAPHPAAAAAGSRGRVEIDTGLAPVDLIITEVQPDAVDETAAARVTLAAAGALRRGGILVVLTHCHHRRGVLVDPGATLVTAGQNADLLYLQHIVAIHDPTLIDVLHPQPVAPSPGGNGPEGQPEVHHRVHSDVYVLAHQHDHPTDALATVPGLTAGADR